LQGISTFLQIHIYSKTIKKKKIIGRILIIFHNKLRKKSFKNSFVWKSYCGEKGHVRLMSSNAFGFFECILRQKPLKMFHIRKDFFLKIALWIVECSLYGRTLELGKFGIGPPLNFYILYKKGLLNESFEDLRHIPLHLLAKWKVSIFLECSKDRPFFYL